MKLSNMMFALTLAASFAAASGQTQTSPRTPPAASAPTAIPALVPFTGMAFSSDGKPQAGEASVTFLIFKDEAGGEPLWAETQIVAVDNTGHYKVQLGAANPSGLPADLFASGEARWLEAQIAGQTPQARILLASVPYALKAADAATLGGLPASAFALAGTTTASATIGSNVVTSETTSAVTTTGGTSGSLPLFTGGSTIADSGITQYAGRIGINTTAPAATLDVNGTSDFRGELSVTPYGAASTSAGAPSYPLNFSAQVYNSTSKAKVDPFFDWQAVPSGNNTSAPGATLNLLYGNGTTSTASETGLYINPNGTVHFASGQSFPGAGTGTITGVTAGTGLIGGGTTGDVTLNLNTSAIPTLGGNNSFSGSDIFVTSLYEDIDVNIDNTNANSGNISPGLRLGKASGEGMASKRTAGGNQYGVDLYTDYYPRLSINGSGLVAIGTGATFNGAQLQVQSGSNVGVQGSSTSSNGLYGTSTNTSGILGVTHSNSSGDAGLYGGAYSVASGVVGISTAGAGGSFLGGSLTESGGSLGENGVKGTGGNGYFYGGGAGGTFQGGNDSDGEGGVGLLATGGSGRSIGGYGAQFSGSNSSSGYGGDGIYVIAGQGSPDGYAGYFRGDVDVTGAITAGTKDFKIDHPLDPANKYLVHSSVESSEMMNIYSGNVVTDELGLATIQLPDWFEAENSDFRYQLTVLGQFAQAIVKNKIANKSFTIMTNSAHVEVSWLVTGVRQDAYAKANPLVVEQDKPANERGFYSHPELYGQPEEKQVEWGRRPQQMKRMKAMLESEQTQNPVTNLQSQIKLPGSSKP